MKFLAMSKRVPGVVDAEVMKHREAEALAVFRLMQAGTFDQIHYSTDWKGAVLFVHAASRQEAQDVLATLPMVRAGCIAFDLYELAPFDHYKRLFKDEFRTAL
jgi:muconolactone delta-isomerase